MQRFPTIFCKKDNVALDIIVKYKMLNGSIEMKKEKYTLKRKQ